MTGRRFVSIGQRSATPGGTPGATEAQMRKSSDAVREGLGQASGLRLAIQTASRTPNARLKFRLFETAGARRPTDRATHPLLNQNAREVRETLRRVALEQASWVSAVRRLARPDAEVVKFEMSTAVPADEADMVDRILNGRLYFVDGQPTNVERIAELMLTAWRTGVKLRFTFLTLGGGNERLLNADDANRGADAMKEWPEWEHLVEKVDSWANVLYGSYRLMDLFPRNVLRMYWSPDHIDPSVLEWAEADPVNKALVSYTLSSLDLGLSFQRAAVRTMARACATLLVQAEEAAAASMDDEERDRFSLGQVLDGIELFNECEIRNIVQGGHADSAVVAMADKTAQRWARGFVMSAIGFVEGFRELKGSDWELPTLYLPGLSSYTAPDFPLGLSGFSFPSVDSGAARSWTWRHVFLDELCRTITRTWGLLRGDWAPLGLHVSTPMPDLPELSSLIGGADLHWYHFNPPTPPTEDEANIGILHAGWLITEIAAAADILEAHGLPGRVTVFESAASSDRSLGYQVAPGKGDEDGITETEALEFQANDVWRRLLSAAAAGSERPSHHPWTETVDTWAGCGLRRPPALEASAAACTARPAWFAFHRAGLLLRDSGPARLVIPDRVPGRTTLVLLADLPNEPWKDVPVLAFEIPDLGVDRIGELNIAELRHAYVLLVDPTADSKDTFVVEVHAPSGGLDRVQQMEPWTSDPADWLVAPSDPDELPRYLVTDAIVFTPRSFASASGGVVELRRGDPVVVLLAPHPLELVLA